MKTAWAIAMVLGSAQIGWARPNCIDQVDKGIVVKGSFAYDRGCMNRKVEVAGKRYDSIHKATVVGLNHLGWAKASPAARKRLALKWTTEVIGRLKAFSVTHSASGEFKKAFYSPKTVSKQGGVVVKFWRQNRRKSWHRPPKTHTHIETFVTYSIKGDLVGIESKRQQKIPAN